MGVFEESFSRIIKNGVSQKQSPKKVNQKVIDGLLGLILQSPVDQDLSILEGFFDSYIWPFFSVDATDSHVLLVAISLQAKSEIVDVTDTEKLHHFIIRSIELTKKKDSSYRVKRYVISAIHFLFLRLSNRIIRREISPFVSILSWSKLPNLEKLLQKNHLKEYYESELLKREKLSSKLKVEQVILNSFLFELLLDAANGGFENEEGTDYLTAVLKLLISLVSQLPTRRYIKTVVSEMNIIPVLKASTLGENTLRAVLKLLEFYVKFPIDDFTGEIIDSQTIMKENSTSISTLQALVYNLFREKLGEIAFASHNTFDNQEKLVGALNSLSQEELEKLAGVIGINPPFQLTESQKVQAIIFQLKPYNSITSVLAKLNSLPSESSLRESIDSTIIPSLDGQYLSLSDFIFRYYVLLRADFFEAISQHLKRTVARFEYKGDKAKNKLIGSSKHATKITSAQFSKGSSSSIESSFAQIMKGTIKVDLNNTSQSIAEEWNSLRKGDVVLLVKVQSRQKSMVDAFENLGISLIYSAIVHGKFNEAQNKSNKSFTLEVSVDADTFKVEDSEADSHREFNLLVKLPAQLSKFNIKLQQILKVVESSDSQLPEWLYESFLGFGNPNSGSYENIEQKEYSYNLLTKGNTLQDVQSVRPDIHLATDEQEQKRRKTKAENKVLDDQAGPFKLNISDKELVPLDSVEDVNSLLRLNSPQLEALIGSLYEGLVIVDGASGTGKRSLVAHICNSYVQNHLGERTLIVSKNAAYLKSCLRRMVDFGIDNQYLFNISDKEDQLEKVNNATNRLQNLLSEVDSLAHSLGILGAYGDNSETAQSFFKYHIHQNWMGYLNEVKSSKSKSVVLNAYPFLKYGKLELQETDSLKVSLEKVTSHYTSIVEVFDEISSLAPLEFLKSTQDRIDHLFNHQSRIIAVTIDDFIESAAKLQKMEFSFQNLVIPEASQLTQLETLLPILLQESNSPERIVLLGDHGSYVPTTYSEQHGGITTSLVKRLDNLGSKNIQLSTQYTKRPSITHLLNLVYPELTQDSSSSGQDVANAGLKHDVQYITIEGKTIEPVPGAFQNIEEAEYAVHLYQYLRLLAYPSDSIAILTFDEAQVALLKEIALAKCSESQASDDISGFAFGIPRISTVQNFRGEESDIVILTTVKSTGLDDRLITAALSASNQGIYVIGSPELLSAHQSCEIDSLLKRIIQTTEDHKLHIVTGEMYSTTARLAGDETNSYAMENLEHFSQFVYEMTQKRTSL